MRVVDDTTVLDAPDFELIDTDGNLFWLSDHRGRNHIVLVFNRGFG